jgi:hypothetical protein
LVVYGVFSVLSVYRVFSALSVLLWCVPP